MKRLLLLCLTAAVLVSCLGLSAQAAPTLSWTEFYTMGDAASAHTRIDPIELDGTTTLFLPASVSRKAVPVYFTLSEKNAVVTATGSRGSVALKSGDTLDLTALCEGTDDTITLRARSGSMQAEKRVTFLRYDNVSTMFLVSDDPVNEGREWVESSEDKSNRAKGSMALLAADGESVYDGKLTQIKGRGNSTWKGAKRPYQIKLDKKTDLLQTGDSADKAKTWVLLANFYDPSAVRNMLALDLGRALQMECNMGYRPVCLFYDGEFRGLYLLTEKVEVNEGRVDVTDLEKANEMANPDVEDLTKLESKTGTTANGATYLYCDGMNDPADITGGYLLEMDFAGRAMEEKCYFITARGFYVVVKSPEACSKAEMDYIASWYQDYEDAVFEGGTSSKTGKPFTDYVTVESMVQCYLVNELSKNGDGFNTSAYLYKETGSEPMKMGPLWDYDLGFGNNNYEDLLPQPELLYTVYGSLGRALYALPEFRAEAQRQYTKYITPLADVLAGDADAVSADGSVHSFAWYREQVAAAAGYDELLWKSSHMDVRPGGNGFAENFAFLQNFVVKRVQWLDGVIGKWSADHADPLGDYMDVFESDWYYDTITRATALGLLHGKGAGIFDPSGITTRAQTAQVIYNIAAPGSIAYSDVFPDVAEGSWYAPAVLWAQREKIVLGYDDGLFRPDRGVSREDMITLLYRYAGSPKTSGRKLAEFRDNASISDYARQAMEWAVENGLILGYAEDGTIRPQSTTTRAEFATIAVRFYEKTNA